MATIRKGSHGAEVRRLQNLLHLAPDGVFGPVTEEAVKAYQLSRNLLVTGVVGLNMWERLQAEIPSPRAVDSIILHSSGTPRGLDCLAGDIARWDRARGLACAACHYIVTLDGAVHHGRDAALVGAHCEGHNISSIGVCYVGGRSSDGTGTPRDTRTAAQRRSLVSLVRRLMDEYGLTPVQVHCHSAFADTACPSFTIDSFREEIG